VVQIPGTTSSMPPGNLHDFPAFLCRNMVHPVGHLYAQPVLHRHFDRNDRIIKPADTVLRRTIGIRSRLGAIGRKVFAGLCEARITNAGKQQEQQIIYHVLYFFPQGTEAPLFAFMRLAYSLAPSCQAPPAMLMMDVTAPKLCR